MREDESFISCCSGPGFLSVDSGFSFTARSVLLPWAPAARHPCETFITPHASFSSLPQAITASFPLLSAQSPLDSDLTFIQSVPLIGSLIFYCLHKNLWRQQGSAEDTPFSSEFSLSDSFICFKRTSGLNTGCVCDTVLWFYVSYQRFVHSVFNKCLSTFSVLETMANNKTRRAYTVLPEGRR